ncbi:MAG: hypothetical protein AB1861_27390 [Cyanobacteriota bacterium]
MLKILSKWQLAAVVGLALPGYEKGKPSSIPVKSGGIEESSP